MIIHYETDGTILGYALIGGFIPDEIPTGEHYLNWNGVTPEPTYNYVVQDGVVVLKSDAEQTAYEMLRSLVGSEMCIRDSFNDVSINPN